MSIDSRPSLKAVMPRVDSADAVLLVRLGERPYGLPLAMVERVLPMAYVPALPGAGDGLLGMLNLHGQVLPVIDLRARLGLPRPPVSAEHRLVLVRTATPFLVWVDEVKEVLAPGEDELSDVPVQHGNPMAPRVLRMGSTVVPILAPAAFEPRGFKR